MIRTTFRPDRASENGRMIRLAEELGFTEQAGPTAGMLRADLTLEEPA